MRRRIAKAAGVAALAVAAAVLVAVVVLAPRDPDSGAVSPVPPDPAAPIETRVDLSPRTVHFGDTVTARVDVTLDRARVRPGSVTVVTGFDPWEPLGKPRETRVDGESTTHLRTTWRLRCVQSVCLPPDTGFTVPFEPVTVTYRPTGDDPGDPIVTSWPQLKVNSRLADDSAPPAAGSGSSPFETPWRADLVTMPAASFRFDPDKLQVPLFAAAGVLALVGLGLAWAARPRRRPKPVEVEEAPPPVQLSPLEHALMLLEDGAAVNGAADRRRALELLAGALAGQGDDELARRARELAWSSHEPGVERTTPIAEEARPRLLIEEEDEADADAEPEEAQQEEEDRSHA